MVDSRASPVLVRSCSVSWQANLLLDLYGSTMFISMRSSSSTDRLSASVIKGLSTSRKKFVTLALCWSLQRYLAFEHLEFLDISGGKLGSLDNLEDGAEQLLEDLLAVLQLEAHVEGLDKG